jgi:hypothetical protein
MPNVNGAAGAPLPPSIKIAAATNPIPEPRRANVMTFFFNCLIAPSEVLVPNVFGVETSVDVVGSVLPETRRHVEICLRMDLAASDKMGPEGVRPSSRLRTSLRARLRLGRQGYGVPGKIIASAGSFSRASRSEDNPLGSSLCSQRSRERRLSRRSFSEGGPFSSSNVDAASFDSAGQNA